MPCLWASSSETSTNTSRHGCVKIIRKPNGIRPMRGCRSYITLVVEVCETCRSDAQPFQPHYTWITCAKAPLAIARMRAAVGIARTTRGAIFAHSALGCSFGSILIFSTPRFRWKTLRWTVDKCGGLTKRITRHANPLYPAYGLATQRYYCEAYTASTL